MTRLAQREEQIMQAFWLLEKAFVKDIIPELPNPRPHYNSVATMARILEEKGFLKHNVVGNMFQYYPIISKDDYQKYLLGRFVKQYFNGSFPNMLSYYAKTQNISQKELGEIIKLIKSKKQ